MFNGGSNVNLLLSEKSEEKGNGEISFLGEYFNLYQSTTDSRNR
jgi:hypothetical protein